MYYASALESYVWMVVPSKAWYRCMNETSLLASSYGDLRGVAGGDRVSVW